MSDTTEKAIEFIEQLQEENKKLKIEITELKGILEHVLDLRPLPRLSRVKVV